MDSSAATSWEAYRRGMLAETERFIEWGLAHPELVMWIPSKPAGDGGFPAMVGQWYWATVLGGRMDGAVRRWRDRLAAVSRTMLGRKQPGGSRLL